MNDYLEGLKQKLDAYSQYTIKDPETGYVTGIADNTPEPTKQKLKDLLWHMAYVETSIESDKYFNKKPIDCEEYRGKE